MKKIQIIGFIIFQVASNGGINCQILKKTKLKILMEANEFGVFAPQSVGLGSLIRDV